MPIKSLKGEFTSILLVAEKIRAEIVPQTVPHCCLDSGNGTQQKQYFKLVNSILCDVKKDNENKKSKHVLHGIIIGCCVLANIRECGIRFNNVSQHQQTLTNWDELRIGWAWSGGNPGGV